MAEATTSSSSDHIEKENNKMEKVEVARYVKKPGAANMKGTLFEVKLAALLFIRCLIKGHPFKIATNMKAAGSFDDIVIGLSGQLPVLMQLKCSTKTPKAVYDYQFTQLKGDFALLKYCETYSSLKKQWEHDLACCGIFEECICVLYTNDRVACLQQPVNKQKKDNNAKDQDINSEAANAWQSLLNTGGSFCPILRETHPQIYEVFKNVPEFKRILKERNNSEELLKAVRILGNKDAKVVPSKEELDKLAVELEKLKGLDCFEEFLPRVWIFGSQTSEKNLNSLIENDVKKLLGERCSKSITNALLESVQRWWQDDNRFLNEDTRLWQDILESRWNILSLAMMKRLFKITVEFDEQELRRLREELSKNIHVIHILAIDSPILTCLKVVRCLKERKCIVVNFKTFEKHQNEIMAYSKHNVFLVLFGEHGDFAAVMQSIKKCGKKKGNWRIIVISRYKHNFETIVDICNLSQLHESSREALLRKHVNFQGQEVPLEKITGNGEQIFSKISGAIIVELLNDSRRMSIGKPPADIIKYYINRTLQRKDHESQEILEENAVFALREKKEPWFSFSNAKDIHEVSRIGKVMWRLHGNGELLQRIQPKGTIQVHKKRTAESQAESCCNKEYCLSERLVVLIAEPGMGKSTFMSYITRELKEVKCSSWVIKINLKYYGEYFSGEDPSPLELLKHASNINGDFQRSLLQMSLDVVGNIFILLDGFDEISPYYTDKAIKLIQRLLHDTKVAQIWITSRPNMREELEDAFHTSCYVLKPLSEADQKALLCKFWNVGDMEVFAIVLLNCIRKWLKDKYREFPQIPLHTVMLAKVFEKEMLHYKNTGENVLPKRLDTLQLYEKFIDIKLKVYLEEKLLGSVYNAGIRDELEAIRQDVYEKYMICAILSIFSQEMCKPPSLEKLKQSIEAFLFSVQQGKERKGIIVSICNGKPIFIHRSFAEYFAAMWLAQNHTENKTSVQNVLFTQRFASIQTFFNRFVTQYCILHREILNEDVHLVEQLIASEPAVLNSVDKCGRTALHLAVINYAYPANSYIQHSRLEILKVILSFQKENMTVSDKLLCWTPLKYAYNTYTWRAADLLLQKGADERDIHFSYAQLNMPSMLTVIVTEIITYGCKKIMEYLIRCKPEVVNARIFINVHSPKDLCTSPLHKASLTGHREIVELLIENGANLEAQEDEFGETALLWAAKSSHWHIVELLISKGADITATNRETGENVIHFAAKSSNIDLLYSLVQDKSLLRHVNAHTLKHNSPVWEAASVHKWENVALLLEKGFNLHCRVAPDKNTLLHFAVKSADKYILCLLLKYPEVVNEINTENGKGESPIECAARAQKWYLVQVLLTHGAVCTPSFVYHAVALGSIDIIQDLLKIPAVFDVLNGTNPKEEYLLMLVANSEQWDKFTCLIKHGLALSKRQAITALQLAVKSNDPKVLDFVLDYSGLDVDVLDINQETAFMCAARKGNLCVLQRLLERGADPLLVHPTGGYTALHLAAIRNNLSVVTFLLENTRLLDDVNRIDSQGRTPLMWSVAGCYDGEIDLLRYLLQFSTELSHRYENNDELMVADGTYMTLEIGDLLMKWGWSPLERDGEGSGPLEVVEWLLSQVANQNEMDENERTIMLIIISTIVEGTIKVTWKF